MSVCVCVLRVGSLTVYFLALHWSTREVVAAGRRERYPYELVPCGDGDRDGDGCGED